MCAIWLASIVLLVPLVLVSCTAGFTATAAAAGDTLHGPLQLRYAAASMPSGLIRHRALLQASAGSNRAAVGGKASSKCWNCFAAALL
jgi:hypothetical protein